MEVACRLFILVDYMRGLTAFGGYYDIRMGREKPVNVLVALHLDRWV